MTLYEKIEALHKSLLSIKTGASKDLMVPAIKPIAPKIPKPSIRQPTIGKIPSGLPPPSKKDPVKMAEQLKNPNPEKVKVEILKTEHNGQWSLEKASPPGEISFTHQHHDLGGVGDLTHVKAVHPVHGVVGEALFEHQPDNSLQAVNVDVHPDHQRKGIGSSLINQAQNITGKRVMSSTGRTTAGEALYNRVKSNFGKDEGKWEDQLPGGKADKKTPDDFDPKALAEGEAHEREHTKDPKLAREIAMDHLTEDPHYYEKIKEVEKK